MIVTTDNKHYGDIANAIRAKLGAEDTYKPDEMADAILDISSGGDPYEIINSIINGSIVELVTYEVGRVLPLSSTGPDILPNLERIIVPHVSYMNTMRNCAKLKTVDTGSTYFGAQVFLNCYALDTLILRADKIPTLANSSNTFFGTKIDHGEGYIYVPTTLYESYKTATNWTVYQAQMRKIEDYPEITGGV